MFQNIKRLVATLMIGTLSSVSALANDSVGRVGAGGIVLEKTAHIRMVRERLRISPNQVRVEYEFKNEFDRDIETLVAFPMPPYRWSPGISPSEDKWKSIDSFIVNVRGQPNISKSVQKRALLENNVDITAQLAKIGLTQSQIFETFGDVYASEDGINLKRSQLIELERIGAVSGRYPNWRVAETVYWRQNFPRNKPLFVSHSYKPFVGSWYSPVRPTDDTDSKWELPPEWDAPNESCIDEAFKATVIRQAKSRASALRQERQTNSSGAFEVYVNVKEVEYILGTGNNWKNAIENFTLIIDRPTPRTLISLCFPGSPSHIGANEIRFEKRNFAPQEKIIVVFVTVD